MVLRALNARSTLLTNFKVNKFLTIGPKLQSRSLELIIHLLEYYSSETLFLLVSVSLFPLP